MRKIILIAFVGLLAGDADAAQRVCTTNAGLGFSSGHAGAPISGNWASLNFAFDPTGTTIIGGTGSLWVCNDDLAPMSPPCASPTTIDVVLTPDTTGANPNSMWISSDSFPGWGGPSRPAIPKTKTTAAIPAYTGVIARFSLDSDSDLVMAKLVDMSGLLGYATLCGQLWQTLGSVGGNPVCTLNSDCQIFAAGDVCTNGYCVDPPAGPPFVPEVGGWEIIAGQGPSCTVDADCAQYLASDPCLPGGRLVGSSACGSMTWNGVSGDNNRILCDGDNGDTARWTSENMMSGGAGLPEIPYTYNPGTCVFFPCGIYAFTDAVQPQKNSFCTGNSGYMNP